MYQSNIQHPAEAQYCLVVLHINFIPVHRPVALGNLAPVQSRLRWNVRTVKSGNRTNVNTNRDGKVIRTLHVIADVHIRNTGVSLLGAHAVVNP